MALKLISLASLAASGVDGARIRASEVDALKSATWAGVKVHNSHLAFDDSRWGENLVHVAAGKRRGEDHFLVTLKESVTQTHLLEACAASRCEDHGNARGGVAFLEFKADREGVTKFLNSHGKLVKHLEPVTAVKAYGDRSGEESVPWGLKRIRSRTIAGQPAEDPGKATGGAGVNVYVLDTGVRVTHAEFGGRAIPGAEVSRWFGLWMNTCDADDVSCASDKQSHGTHCAGTIAGATYGVAKGATIYAVKVLFDNGSGTNFGITNGIDWVATNHIKPAVASMSLGGGFSEALNDAVTALVESGVTVVTASGNENTDACTKSPGSTPASINVGATNVNDTRAVFSNYGECLTIWAPGRDVLSSVHESDIASATYSGTSMACPHVSGAAAIILEANPSFAPRRVKEELVEVATDDVISDIMEGSPPHFLYSAA